MVKSTVLKWSSSVGQAAGRTCYASLPTARSFRLKASPELRSLTSARPRRAPCSSSASAVVLSKCLRPAVAAPGRPSASLCLTTLQCRRGPSGLLLWSIQSVRSAVRACAARSSTSAAARSACASVRGSRFTTKTLLTALNPEESLSPCGSLDGEGGSRTRIASASFPAP